MLQTQKSAQKVLSAIGKRLNRLLILRLHCHAINTASPKIGNCSVEEAKKMKCYKRLMLRFLWPTVSELFARNISRTFVELCMETLYWWNMAAGNPQKRLGFTFPIKALPFHSRASIRAHKHIF